MPILRTKNILEIKLRKKVVWRDEAMGYKDLEFQNDRFIA